METQKDTQKNPHKGTPADVAATLLLAPALQEALKTLCSQAVDAVCKEAIAKRRFSPDMLAEPLAHAVTGACVVGYMHALEKPPLIVN